ncbi:MAG TPA: RNA polymerase factor sigma-54 [Xanthobacteraceae bacterium]|nr:RNA polymerase factor sigma-54 [Xanthobacteraceae bacterium]
MALSQKLELRQGQALVMTPQLMQAIKLLQLSHLDLAAFVDAELERNPLLERAEPERSEEPAAEVESVAESGGTGDGERSEEWLGDSLETSRSAIEDKLDTGLENVFPEDTATSEGRATPRDTPGYSEWAGVGAGGREGGDYNLEAFVSAEVTLADHLARQLTLAIEDPVQRIIGQYLIDLVDEAGYLRGDVAGIAEKLGASASDVAATLDILQTFDPPGVCARDLAECLTLQLKERDRYDPAIAALVANLDLLAKRDFAGLKRVCGIDEEDLVDMVGEIRRLNPKPGLAFGGGAVQPIVPDVFVRPAPDGGWNVELNADTLPRVLVNQSYYARVSKTTRSDKEKTFLADCLQTATWLTRSLDQRARTILKVAIEIVRQQDAFLVQGVQHLRPLNLRMIADAIKMHESTVSRVTANKYMATPRGIFELKYFFSSAIAAADGGAAHSAEAVRDRIREMIEAEQAEGVLSDDTIVQKLKEAGVDIARRTVAKYRESMRIPSSVQRRRDKQADDFAS